jgi:hypothetical protein
MIIDLSLEPLDRIKRENLDNQRSIDFFTDNSLNAIPLANFPIMDYLFNYMVNEYSNSIQGLNNLLIADISIMSLFMIVTIVMISSIRTTFKFIFLSYLNVTEGELEERTLQLSKLGELLAHLKQKSYFMDIMGNFITERPSNNSNKTNKKFGNLFYCFGLLTSIFALLIFYLINILSAG